MCNVYANPFASHNSFGSTATTTTTCIHSKLKNGRGFKENKQMQMQIKTSTCNRERCHGQDNSSFE